MGHRKNSKNKSNGRETLEREHGCKRQTPMFQQKYTIRDGGSTALFTAYAVIYFFTLFTLFTVFIDFTHKTVHPV